jgi:hypothetical protein
MKTTQRTPPHASQEPLRYAQWAPLESPEELQRKQTRRPFGATAPSPEMLKRIKQLRAH